MAQHSTIEWTDTTWNPVVGCRKVSAGCKYCYAERMANRLAAMATADQKAGRNAGKKASYLNVLNHHGQWNGSVLLDEDAVLEPLSWRTPRVIFVNSMSDLFHETVPLWFIRSVFDVIERCPQHTFQILTKRPERVVQFDPAINWPRNAWMGTSVEDEHVIERVKQLRKTSAQVKFLSVEPLLGPISRLPVTGINWVIVGGESGPGARPMNANWVRQIRDRCIRYGVPFFFKQWGGPNKGLTGRVLDGRTWDEMPELAHVSKDQKTNEQRFLRRGGSSHQSKTSDPSRVPKRLGAHSGARAKQPLALF